MIFQAFLDPLFSLLEIVINFIPIMGDLPIWIDNTLNLLSYVLMFFPRDVFLVILANVTFWMGLDFLWSVIEWVYKKIPGID